MKITLALTTCLLALPLLPVHAEKTELGNTMKDLADATKRVKADLAITDDTKHNKDADLKDVATMQADAIKGRNFAPKKEESLPPDQQAAMTVSYQKDMDAFIADIKTLGADIQGDKWAAARTDFQKLIDDEKSGHKAYRVKHD